MPLIFGFDLPTVPVFLMQHCQRISMPNPTHHNAGIWKDAELLIERVELSARGNAEPTLFFEDLVGGLRLTTRSSAVTLSVSTGDELVLLARSGVMLHAAEANGSPVEPFGVPSNKASLGFTSHCRWFDR